MTPHTLFEISWEVAHKVGGIHTVVSTKARSFAQRLGDDFVLLGPWLLERHDVDAVLEHEPGHEGFEAVCRGLGLPVRVGRWRVPGRPLTVLVEFSGLYARKDEILTELWLRDGVDSLFGGWEYVEPVLFGYAAGVVVESWWREVVAGRRTRAVVHAHEWMTGAALLYLSHRVPEMATVFTAHATVLGRAAGAKGMTPGQAVADRGPAVAAAELGVRARHSLESTLARRADVFTTVSEVCSEEALLFLGRAADPVLPNGLDPVVTRDRLHGVDRAAARGALRRLANRFLGEDVSGAVHVVGAARYEFRNKGLDVLLDAAGELARRPGPPVVLWLLVPAGNSGVHREVVRRMASDDPVDGPVGGIALHHLFDEEGDAIAQRCRELGLENAPGSRVRVVHWAEYLDVGDGLLGLSYEAGLSAADFTCFPSAYEAWGYTPQESLTVGVPTLTTDCAGFGRWALAQGFDPESGVTVLARRGRTDAEVTQDLLAVLERAASAGAPSRKVSEACERAASRTSWEEFGAHYVAAHEAALALAERRGPRPRVPEGLEGLVELARNWWWCWDREARTLFEDLDPEAWEAFRHGPLELLRSVDPEHLRHRAADAKYRARLDGTVARQRAYLAAPLDERGVTVQHPAAYFCAEFGVHESMPIYSGGLGVLAGDHLRAASDLGVPLVAVGLLYRQGYMRQRLTGGIHQENWADSFAPEMQALEPVTDSDGAPVEVELFLPGARLVLRAWRADVGRVRLFLLDADIPGNRAGDRGLTHSLYGGDQETRIRQEMILGIGGVRLLERLGIAPSAWHINEGHGAFVALERIRRLLRETELTFDEAREVVRDTTVFTTHTPVPAGHDAFPEELMRRHFADERRWFGLPWPKFLALGSSAERPDSFNMTALAARTSSRINGVSVRHARVSRGIVSEFLPQIPAAELRVESVTNGVHLAEWTAPEMKDLLGAEPGEALGRLFAGAPNLDPAAVWRARCAQRARLVAWLRRRARARLTAEGADEGLMLRVDAGLVDDALYIGFARRFATYKRADLLLRDADRLHALVSDDGRPVRILLAGKAHPRDGSARELVAKVGRLTREPRFRGRVILLEDYDMSLARRLLHGVDVWLNTPRPPMEASGTSGMKAAANGALNVSTADGWWLEAADGVNGWTVGDDAPGGEERDEDDAESLLRILETQVVPEFFDRDAGGVPRRWVARVKASLASIPPVFDTVRMVTEYRERFYEPLAMRHAKLARGGYGAALATLASPLRVRRALAGVRVASTQITGVDPAGPAADAQAQVDVLLCGLEPGDVVVELLHGDADADLGIPRPERVELAPTGECIDGAHRFRGVLHVAAPATFAHRTRVRPRHPGTDGPALHDPVVWG